MGERGLPRIRRRAVAAKAAQNCLVWRLNEIHRELFVRSMCFARSSLSLSLSLSLSGGYSLISLVVLGVVEVNPCVRHPTVASLLLAQRTNKKRWKMTEKKEEEEEEKEEGLEEERRLLSSFT